MVVASLPVVLLWVVLAPAALVAVTVASGRLLGVRRGWTALGIAGVIGWTAAVICAGAVTGWEWDSASMIVLSLALGILFTMMVALGLDLFAPLGSLAQGEEAGLVSFRNPVKAFRTALLPLRRYREVLHLARANGVARAGRRLSPDALPAGVRQTLEQAGGMFVKLGQVASTRSDLLPAAWCDELALLRSQAAPEPRATIQPELEERLGATVDATFANFDWVPMASASIAQVYAAELPDGTAVVVKVERPGLDEVMARDSAAIMQLADLVERHTRLGLAVRPRDLAAEFIANVQEELDFRIEATNAVAIAAAVAGSDRVRVPSIDASLSSERVLVEERISGTPIDDGRRLRELGLDPAAVAARLLDCFLTQIFEVGVFHADPHPGNILVEDDGTIVLIDLGAVGRLGPSQRAVVLQMMAAASIGDAGLLRQALTDMTRVSEQADLRELDRALDDLLGRYMRAGGGITAGAFQDLAVLVGQYGIHLPRWFGILSRTMVTLEGTLHAIDRSFSLVDAAKARAGAELQTRTDRASIRQALEHEAMVQLPRLQRLPQRLDDLLGQAADGRLTARVSLFSNDRDERVLRSLVDRIVVAVLAASLGIGSVMLLNVETGTIAGGEVGLNEVLGYVGLAAASILALRVIAGVVRDGLT